MDKFILAIDQGTTSTRAILFDKDMKAAAVGQQEFTQHFPASGWVEHDAEEIWQSTLNTINEAMDKVSASASDIKAIGITNQRETTVIWDRKTGAPIHNAIVWQDRRTADYCQSLKDKGLEGNFTAKTGLLLDPYFSGTKVRWLLENVEGARARAENGELAFGTIDTYLLWKLTDGKAHATDATNASRTLMYDIIKGKWSSELTDILEIPEAILPEVKDSAADFGTTDLFGAPIPITGIAGDQQAATVGQACFKPGMMKSTYGTGCFAILNTGDTPVMSENRLLTTIAYQLDGKTTYALEGSIFVAGSAVQWLRDGLQIIDEAAQSGEHAEKADPEQEVIMVPAFVGLGAPYWDAECRGAMYGLTRGTGAAEICKAALESVCYQTRDLLEAMQADMGGTGDTVLRVDGGMVASDWTMQCLSDFLNAPVDRPEILETTAIGAAYLAGLKVGFYPEPGEFAKSWKCETRFAPKMAEDTRNSKYANWKDAIGRTLSNYKET
ncbi:glycerol kinase GlpK [Sneathiella sp. P13V-1]|uniref:glycerol kinase GlpK n=1 Tax=Sneathiella sp. P13V-1 TaxID=2697366 RepID=UPI00187B7381|nr:glycerol kinase GlpK [Sneathiella sp. P13V-1]MBE7638190.1 glycerol kinase GlpK [Sneathiella sp. P13V-1]